MSRERDRRLSRMSDDDVPPMTRPRVASGVLFFELDGRVLVVKPNYKAGWDIPGGYVEPGETPREACIRETREELGFEPNLGDLLVADWAPSETEGDKVLFVFDGGTVTAERAQRIRLGLDELEQWAFKAPDELRELMPARLERRIDQAISAHHAQQTRYLEHGAVGADQHSRA